MKFVLLLFLLLNVYATENNKQPVASYDIKPELVRLPYNISNSIYWDSNHNIYYGSKSFIATNSINYNFDSVKATNHIYYTNRYSDFYEEYNWNKNEFIYLDTQIYKYVGSLSFLKRVYIDTNEPPQQYINTLVPIDDSIYLCFDGNNYSNIYPVYPAQEKTFTNKYNNIIFFRNEKYILHPIDPITNLQ